MRFLLDNQDTPFLSVGALTCAADIWERQVPLCQAFKWDFDHPVTMCEADRRLNALRQHRTTTPDYMTDFSVLAAEGSWNLKSFMGIAKVWIKTI